MRFRLGGKIAPQSDCDLPVPGPPVETCGDLSGEIIAIGGSLDVRCTGAFDGGLAQP